MEQATLRAGGMTCMSCVRKVEGAVGEIDGVDSAEADLGTEEVRITFDPTVVGITDLESVIVAAGYEVDELEPES